MKSQPDWFWFWFDNGSTACGALATDENGVVRHSCPYYWRYRGKDLNEVILDLRKRGSRPKWKRLPAENSRAR